MSLNSNNTSEVTSTDSLVESVKQELSDIDNSQLTEHAVRFEALHSKLTDALNSIDGL